MAVSQKLWVGFCPFDTFKIELTLAGFFKLLAIINDSKFYPQSSDITIFHTNLSLHNMVEIPEEY